MKGGGNFPLSVLQTAKCFLQRPLAQPTRRPVRNRRAGHPAERWVEKNSKQGKICVLEVRRKWQTALLV